MVDLAVCNDTDAEMLGELEVQIVNKHTSLSQVSNFTGQNTVHHSSYSSRSLQLSLKID